jgi:hypothetical protein
MNTLGLTCHLQAPSTRSISCVVYQIAQDNSTISLPTKTLTSAFGIEDLSMMLDVEVLNPSYMPHGCADSMRWPSSHILDGVGVVFNTRTGME